MPAMGACIISYEKKIKRPRALPWTRENALEIAENAHKDVFHFIINLTKNGLKCSSYISERTVELKTNQNESIKKYNKSYTIKRIMIKKYYEKYL